MATKILIVDDSLTARHVLKNFLASPEVQLFEGRNGKEALQTLAQHPDMSLIFTDMNMPWMTGLELIEELKAHPSWQKIPVCITSTDSSPALLKAAKQLGVNAYLVKPIKAEQIQTMVQNFLNRPVNLVLAKTIRPPAHR
ncbi:MAG: response regulator [Oligoflexus sp.]